jgi:hypothetical protein
MYALLCDRLPERVARPLAALLYALMLLAVVYFSFEQEAEFNYLVT